MYVVLDTETTGLPKSWRAPPSDTASWPRIVQLAWAVYDARGRKTNAESCVVRPEGFIIPKAAERIHGISTAKARRDGRDLREVLASFALAIRRADVVVSHNLRFDENVVSAEFHRIGEPLDFHRKTRLCTMVAATEYCQIPGLHGFKWPTLVELHTALFGRGPQDAHDAAADVVACAKCFFELKRLGVIRVAKGRGA